MRFDESGGYGAPPSERNQVIDSRGLRDDVQRVRAIDYVRDVVELSDVNTASPRQGAAVGGGAVLVPPWLGKGKPLTCGCPVGQRVVLRC